jgi:hypothetical protein
MNEYDDELLDLDQIMTQEGLDLEEAREVLGPHTALPRWEVYERYEMLQREQQRNPIPFQDDPFDLPPDGEGGDK